MPGCRVLVCQSSRADHAAVCAVQGQGGVSCWSEQKRVVPQLSGPPALASGGEEGEGLKKQVGGQGQDFIKGHFIRYLGVSKQLLIILLPKDLPSIDHAVVGKWL